MFTDDGSEPQAHGYVCQDPDINSQEMIDRSSATKIGGERLAHRIINFCHEYGLNQEQFAEYAGVDEKSLNNWISGRHNPSVPKGAKVEQFMIDYAKTHAKQMSLTDIPPQRENPLSFENISNLVKTINEGSQEDTSAEERAALTSRVWNAIEAIINLDHLSQETRIFMIREALMIF